MIRCSTTFYTNGKVPGETDSPSLSINPYPITLLRSTDLSKRMFDLQPWQLWEKFGAYFYALRINSFLVLGKSQVTVGELLNGALIAEDIRSVQIQLVPTSVFTSQDAFGADTSSEISRQHNPKKVVDWIKSGYIVINGDGGEGVDIFFAQRNAVEDQVVVFVDQRKRTQGKFHSDTARSILDKLIVCPEFLQESALVDRGVMNCVSLAAFGKEAVPPGCYLMSREQSAIFHGSLAYHPACIPCVSINTSCKTALKTVLTGRSSTAVDRAAEKLVRKRKEMASKGECFENKAKVAKFLSDEKEDVMLIDEFVEFSC
jgi:hypothetical protein